MKKVILVMMILCAALLVAFGCSEEKQYGDNDFTATFIRGDIGSFSAETPTNGETVWSIPVLSWTAAENAATYDLEIASTTDFLLDDELYIKKTGIVDTHYNLLADLRKNQTYYWRVTAVNRNDSRYIDGEVNSFYYEATLSEEIPLAIGYADEWKVHEVGSKATVSLDHKNFFKNEKESLKVSFDREDTQRGPAFVESNGWVVVTRSLETEFYGVDAFYFNFYYAGNDAAAYFRVIDEDNEYWVAPIKLATNSKQTVIIRFDEFVLRTKGTPVMNEEFDYNYLKSVELVFERVDGDGIAYFSDLRAIRYSNYEFMFVEELDFETYEPTVKEGSYFNFTNTPKEDGKALTVAFTTNPEVPGDELGYGFTGVKVNRMLAKGDAFSFDLDLSGIDTKNYNLLIRVVEEDNDVWQFMIPAADVPADGKMLVPFAAFTLATGGFKGDGIKQFYFIKQIVFGVQKLYQAGSFTVSNFSLASLADVYGEELYTTTVGEDGVLENFESYENFYEVYYKWETSTANKDEAIQTYVDPALGVKNVAARFGYKTDLPEARYTIKLADQVKGFTAIEISAKDESILNADATMIVYLQGDPDELYSYTIDKLPDEWKSYTIPLADFSLTADSFGSSTITCERITEVSIAFQYYYQKKGIFDFSDPAQYNSGNHVCVDNICFVNATEYEVKDVSNKIKPSASDSKIAVISDFDDDTEETLIWEAVTVADRAKLLLSETTAPGSGKSLSMGYKCKEETIYSANIAVDSSVKANGITLLMKGDAHASKAVVVLYLSYNSKVLKYQTTIDAIAADWTVYSLGFGAFTQTEGDTLTLTQNHAQYVTQIVINYKNYDAADYYTSAILLDEIVFNGKIEIGAKTAVAYEA